MQESRTCTTLVQTPSHLCGMDCTPWRGSNPCTALLVLTLRLENRTLHTEYWCQGDSVQDDLCCTCFLIDCLLQLWSMKKGFIHHPTVMSFYMQTQFRALASQMDCLWKRQRLSGNHSLLCDCTAGLERKGGWWRMVDEGWGRGGQPLVQPGTFASSYSLASLTPQGKRWINGSALSHSG